MTITEFLLARFDDDEAVARDVQHQAAVGRPFFTITAGGTGVRRLANPEHWLDEVAAKRQLLDRHSEIRIAEPAVRRACDPEPVVLPRVVVFCECSEWASWPCITLRILAAVYADHPDYDTGWAL